MNDDSWQLLLTDELVDEFWDYYCEEETIRLYSGNVVAEIEFLNEVELDQRVVTSTVEAFLFLPESPLLKVQATFEASARYNPATLAKIVQWRLLQRVRVNAGQPTFDEVAYRKWLKADAYPTSVSAEEAYPKYLGDVDDLTPEAAQNVAEHIIAHFPEIAEHLVLVRSKSEVLGYRGLREVGLLTATVAIISNARRALLGDVGSRDCGKTHKIASVWEGFNCQVRPHSISSKASRIVCVSG